MDFTGIFNEEKSLLAFLRELTQMRSSLRTNGMARTIENKE
jgi:hypothetical protein